MKNFDIPIIYRSPLISAIKKKRKELDKMKRNFQPTLLDFGPLKIFLARHFGFCYGVENAIEIAYKTVDENPGKRIFLLSEMIHNPQVNADLKAHGILFLQDTYGNVLIPFDELTAGDIVMIPAFGTTLEMEARLKSIGLQTEKYNTTCPFVEKVWNRSELIAQEQYSVIIHGKPGHEETRATFSHASSHAPSVLVRDMEEANRLAAYIRGEKPAEEFYTEFSGRYSNQFSVPKDLQRFGVVNQTTMLASDTQAIADYLKQVMADTFPEDDIREHFADTRDTLCYATNDNQSAVLGMLQATAHFAIVIGGYNSSNTSHLVELCEERMPTYFINDETKLISPDEIRHYLLHKKEELTTTNWLPASRPVTVLVTSGASCPDALVEGVIHKLAGFFPDALSISSLLKQFQ